MSSDLRLGPLRSFQEIRNGFSRLTKPHWGDSSKFGKRFARNFSFFETNIYVAILCSGISEFVANPLKCVILHTIYYCFLLAMVGISAYVSHDALETAENIVSAVFNVSAVLGGQGFTFSLAIFVLGNLFIYFILAFSCGARFAYINAASILVLLVSSSPTTSMKVNYLSAVVKLKAAPSGSVKLTPFGVLWGVFRTHESESS